MVLREMEARYESLGTFGATGKVVTEIGWTNGGTNAPFASSSTTFSMKLARPDFYRIEWTQKMDFVFSHFTRQAAAWSSGGGHFVLMPDGKVSRFLNRELVLKFAADVAGGGPREASSLFFKKGKEKGPADSLKNPSREPDEKIDGEDCYVVSADYPDGKEILWITRSDSFLKQYRFTYAGKAPQESSPTQPGMSDSMLKQWLKLDGLDMTPEEF